MRKLFFVLFSVATLSSASYAKDVLVINNSDYKVIIHSYHELAIKRAFNIFGSWVSGTDSGQTTLFSVEPHSTTTIFVQDEGDTAVTFYRMSLRKAVSNTVWVGTTYAGSTALTATNAFVWFPAAAVAAKTTWNGLPFSRQIVNVDQGIEEGKIRAILIENYENNQDTIQTKQGSVELADTRIEVIEFAHLLELFSQQENTLAHQEETTDFEEAPTSTTSSSSSSNSSSSSSWEES